MYKSGWVWLFLTVIVCADVTMKQTRHHDDQAGIPEHPIHRPGYHHPDYIPTEIIVETPTDCSQYIKLLKEKDAYIESLLQELAVLREKEQQRLSKKLKKEHEAELEKFKARKSSIKTKNMIIIKDKKEP